MYNLFFYSRFYFELETYFFNKPQINIKLQG